jgi:uncharacterized protein (DUF2062 family)
VARGFAAGAFTGVMPLFGVQTILAMTLATVARGNPFAAALSTWISNPLTFVPLYMVNFKVGQILLGTQQLELRLAPDMTFPAVLQLGVDCLVTLTIGCVAVGIPAAGIAYLLGFGLAKRWRSNRRRSRDRRRSRYSQTR